jgi:hypothetical protein
MNNHGPISYENWKAEEKGEEVQYCVEFPLFTDAYVTGEITHEYGPYQVLNTTPQFKPQLIAPALILRIEEHLKNDPTRKTMIKTDTTFYHGGWLADEIAALFSLNLGIRLKAGGATRRFEPGGDPKGRPEILSLHKDPVFIKNPAYRPVIPYDTDTYCINDAHTLRSYPKLSPTDAVALVKAARLYQDALWISEFQPSFSWLFFVSAIETSANHWRRETELPLDRMRAFKPELEKLLNRYSSELPEKVANVISEYMGSTKKFLAFVIHFLPDPPAKRPSKPFQTAWETPAMEKSLRKIYAWRSKALHGGTPFPEPMCIPPLFPPGEVYGEKQPGLAVQSMGGTWTTDDIPMCLHIFEYIVRHSLLNWWDSMLNRD